MESPAEFAWLQQSVWSQTANRLKANVGQWRTAALSLTITGGILATLAGQIAPFSSGAGRALAGCAAVVVAVVPVLQRKFNQQVVRDWTRARSASEGLKSEVYLFLAAVGPYRGPTRDRHLVDEVEQILRNVTDLLPQTVDVQPATRPLPGVHNVDTYFQQRVGHQIDGYYRPQAAAVKRRLTRVRRAELALAVTGAGLSAASAALGAPAAAVWVPVATTVIATVAAHAAAARYGYVLLEYSRTASQLEHLRREWQLTTAARNWQRSDDQFVEDCERVISAQNEGWMAKLAASDDLSNTK